MMDLIEAGVGTIPGPDNVLNIYNIFKSGGELLGCWSYLYDWSIDVSVDGNEIESFQENYKTVDKYGTINKIVGETEDERNNRRVENMVYFKDPRSEIGVAPRSVVITIPVHPKDNTIESDMRMWIDIRGYLSGARDCGVGNSLGANNPGNMGTGMLENIGANMVYSLATNSIGIYFENADMFQTYSEPLTETNAHPPMLNNAEVNHDCESEGDPFTFSVVYKDEDGDEAKEAYIRIVGFDGTEKIYDTQDDIKLGKMIKGDGEPATGVLYTYTTRLPEAPEYYYMFYFSDLKGKKVYLPLEGFSSPELGYAVPAAKISCGESATVSDGVEVIFPDPNPEGKQLDRQSPASEDSLPVQQSPMNLICQGNQFYSQGEYSKALNNYESALEIEPSNSLALKCKGWTLQTMGRPEDAIEPYEKVIEQDPTDYYAWINKGGAFYDQGKYEEAIEYYKKATDLDPLNPYAWNARGAASASQGNHEEALGYYEKALELDPNYCLALNNEANSLKVLGRNAEAQTAIDKAKNLGESGCKNYGGLPPMDASCE